jgi:uncharacterized protein
MPNPKTKSSAPKPQAQNGWVRKCELDAYLGRHLPIPTQVVSNEEYIPLQQTAKQQAVEHRLLQIGADNARKLGIDRRQFFRTSCGMAAAFAAMNSVFGHFFRVDAAELLDAAAAAELKTDYFIFDVQTHHVAVGHSKAGPMDVMEFRRQGATLNPELQKHPPVLSDLYLENYIKEVFLDSDTTVSCITGIPGLTDETCILPPEQMVATRRWVNELSHSQRMVSHGLMSPDLGTRNLEAMNFQGEKLKINAWKSYTGQGLGPNKEGWWLDDETVAYPSLELSRKLGVKNICVTQGTGHWPFQRSSLPSQGHGEGLERLSRSKFSRLSLRIEDA